MQDTANESHLFLPSQPPASPLLHFIFYTSSCPSGATTPGIPTPYQHRLLFSTDYNLIVGTLNVYKLPPFKDGWSIRLLRINPVAFSPSFSYAFVSHLVASALARVEPLSTLCLVSLSSGDLSCSGTCARGSAVHLVSIRLILLSHLLSKPLSHRILSGTTTNLAAAIIATTLLRIQDRLSALMPNLPRCITSAKTCRRSSRILPFAFS